MKLHGAGRKNGITDSLEKSDGPITALDIHPHVSWILVVCVWKTLYFDDFMGSAGWHLSGHYGITSLKMTTIPTYLIFCNWIPQYLQKNFLAWSSLFLCE